jgi:hypothetical protein
MRSLACTLFLLLAAAPASAKIVEIRPDQPVAQFDIPDDWTTTRTDRGIQSVSKDKEVYFWIEAYKPDEFQDIINEHNAYWKDQGVVITSSDEEKKTEAGKEVSVTNEHATWNGKPTVLYYVEFHLGLPSQTNIVLTYWASPEGDAAYQKQVGDALSSLSLTEK